MLWKKRDGSLVKLKDLTTDHLLNILKKFKTKLDKSVVRVIEQEIRLRKLNRIQIDSENDKLF